MPAEASSLRPVVFDLQARGGVDGSGDSTKTNPNLVAKTDEEVGGQQLVVAEDPKKPAKESARPTISLFRLLFQYADKTDIFFMIFGTFAAMIGGAALPCFSIIFGQILDGLNLSDVNALVDQVSKMTMWLTVIGAVDFLASWAHTSLWMMQAERQAKRIRTECLKSILRQEMSWFDSQKPGELSTRITLDVKEIQDGINEKIGNTVAAFATFVTGIAIGFAKGWQLALLILGAIPFLAASGALMTALYTSATKRSQGAYAAAGDIAEEVLSSIRTVCGFTAEDRELKRFSENIVEAKKAGEKKGIFSGVSQGFMMFTIFCTYGLAFWFGVWLVVNNVYNASAGRSYTGGDTITIFFALLIAAFHIGQAGPYFPAMLAARAAGYSIFQICERKSAIDVFDDSGETIPDLKGCIEFKDVHFDYPNRKDAKILRGVNFTVDAGKKVALVGHSGCGKSTSYALIQRFYDPLQGTVSMDGKDIRTLNVRWLRENIGVVGQEPVLFATSIKENIRFGKKDATDEEIVAACKAANAHDFVSKLPKGYDTYVGDIGSQLSGGQKQRIAIARALVKNPKILLLDEATSALDNESERVVQAALEVLMKGRTVLVIAHRLSTIQDADTIHVFEAGQVVESGTHAQLMAKDSAYAELVHAQSTRHNEESDAANVAAGAEEVVKPLSGKADVRHSHESMERTGSAGKHRNSAAHIEGPPPSVPFGRILGLAKPVWFFTILSVVGGMLNGGAFPTFSLVFSRILNVYYENISNDEKLSQARFYALMFVVLGAGLFLANVLQWTGIAYVGELITYRIRQLAFKSLLRQNIGFFDEESHSSRLLGAQLQNDTALIQAVSMQRISLTVQTFSCILVGVIIAMIANWKLTLVLMSVAPLVAIAGLIQSKFMAGFSTSGTDTYAKAGQIAGEAVSNVRTVASFTCERDLLANYSHALEPQVRQGIRRAHISGIAFGFSQFFMFGAFALVMWYGSTLVKKGEITFQQMMQVIFAILWSAMIIGQVNSLLPEIEKAKMACKTVFGLIDRVPPIDSASDAGEKFDFTSAAVEFKAVHFHYPTRPDARILRGLNLTIPGGATVALVGPSGCGKSTTVALLQRFYDPLSGSVLVDGKDIRTMNIKHFRQQVGIVSQEPVLFASTIRENIRYARPTATEEEIVSAAQLANIHAFIMSLPAKYDTQVGPRGSQLSGGQKQRIAIARAVLKNPKILLLDEATSALDTQSEKVVQAALEQVMTGRTTIVVAHRLSTIRKADLIAYFDQGVVAESGRHEELMQKNGKYAQLVMQGALHRSTTTQQLES